MIEPRTLPFPGRVVNPTGAVLLLLYLQNSSSRNNNINPCRTREWDCRFTSSWRVEWTEGTTRTVFGPTSDRSINVCLECKHSRRCFDAPHVGPKGTVCRGRSTRVQTYTHTHSVRHSITRDTITPAKTNNKKRSVLVLQSTRAMLNIWRAIVGESVTENEIAQNLSRWRRIPVSLKHRIRSNACIQIDKSSFRSNSTEDIETQTIRILYRDLSIENRLFIAPKAISNITTKL